MKSSVGVVAGLALTFAVAALAACTTLRTTSLPHGARGYTIDCSGASLTWSHCYRRAGSVCPHGYSVVRKLSKGGPLVAGELFQAVGDAAQRRRLVIECRDAAAAVPDGTAPAPRPAGSVNRPVAGREAAS